MGVTHFNQTIIITEVSARQGLANGCILFAALGEVSYLSV